MNDDDLHHFLDLPEAHPNGGPPDTQTYIWITRWEDFQHYRPERDRPPAWIKTYTKQLDDYAYLRLTPHQRGVLHDLRSAFCRAHAKLPSDTRHLSATLNARVSSVQLQALNHAGFIEFISRPTLEQRLEKFYSSPRARVEVEVEVEKEPPNPRRSGGSKPRVGKTKNHVCPDCGVGAGHHTSDCPSVQPPANVAELLPSVTESF